MKFPALPIALLAFAAMMPYPAIAQQMAAKQDLKCETGPVQRTYGASSWLVYSCDDGQSLVITTTADNPAAPFYFTFFPDSGHYRLHGEGSGSKAESAAAFKEIQHLSQQDIATLLAATKAPNSVPVTK